MNARPFLRLAGEFLALVCLHAAGLWALDRWRVLEKILSPTPETAVYASLAVAWLLVRMFLLVCAPGWLLARTYLLWVRRREGDSSGQ